MSDEEEFLKCMRSPTHFLDNYAWIQDPVTFQTIKLKLDDGWEYLRDVLDTFATERLLVILKARQLGISTLVSGWALWTAMFNDNANILLLSKRENEAARLMAKTKFIYDHLPSFLRARLLKSTDSRMIFAGDMTPDGKYAEGSSILVLPATKDAGRSETASVVICDEWAYHPYADINYSAYKPTIDAGGQLIGLSSANGLGNLFFRTYDAAKKGQNNFKSLFLPWNLRPDRSQAWFDGISKEYAPEILHQEYPGHDMEAFIITGGSPFDTDAVRFYLENVVMEPLSDVPLAFQSLSGNGVSVWEVPKPGKRYCIGADPAEGIGGDASSASVMSTDGEQVCKISGDFDPDKFANILNLVGHLYNGALIAVERNNHGHAVLNSLMNYLGYDRIYRHLGYDQKLTRKIYRAGWPTNSKEKHIMIADIVAAIREKECLIRDVEFFDQAITFGGARVTDDAVVANAIAWQAIKSPQARARQGVRSLYKPAIGRRVRTTVRH